MGNVAICGVNDVSSVDSSSWGDHTVWKVTWCLTNLDIEHWCICFDGYSLVVLSEQTVEDICDEAIGPHRPCWSGHRTINVRHHKLL